MGAASFRSIVFLFWAAFLLPSVTSASAQASATNTVANNIQALCEAKGFNPDSKSYKGCLEAIVEIYNHQGQDPLLEQILETNKILELRNEARTSCMIDGFRPGNNDYYKCLSITVPEVNARNSAGINRRLDAAERALPRSAPSGSADQAFECTSVRSGVFTTTRCR